MVNIRNQDITAAIDDMTAIVGLDPHVLGYYMDRAQLYILAGDPLSAAADLEQVLADPDVAERHFAMAGDHWPSDRGRPDVDMLTAAAKVADARTRAEALDWLRPVERMRVLGDRRTFDTLVSLPAA